MKRKNENKASASSTPGYQTRLTRINIQSKTRHHPWRPRVSQSGQEKRCDKSFQAGVEEPLGTDSHQTLFKMASDWAQKILCITVPNRRTASPEFFSFVRT